MMLCGKCLHARDCHTEDNGHFMYCSACQKLCDRDEFKTVHTQTDTDTIYKIQMGREYSEYKPKELKA